MARAEQAMTIEAGGREVEVRVIRSARRRRTVSLGVADGVVVVRAPLRTPQAELLRMVAQRAGWVVKRLAAEQAVPPRAFVDGATLPYLGREVALRVVAGPGRRAAVGLDRGVVVARVPAESEAETRGEQVRRALERWYRERASELFSELVGRWSAAAGVSPRRVVVATQRSRWGSCGPDGTIRLNWRLILADRELAEYVVVHELAHLEHRHHQAGFWAAVERLLPDYRERRRRLTAVAPSLAW